MSVKHVSFFTELKKLKSIWCCIALFLLLVISSCATNEVSSHPKSNVVLNHIILTVDQTTFTSIIKSEFIKDTFSAIKISSPQSGSSDSWSRAYIYGQNTYIELFSRDNLKSEDFSGVGFGVDAAGDLDTLLYSIPDSLSDDFTKQTMYKNTDKGKQPWFYFITSTTAYTDYKLRIFVMEYDYDFIKSRFLDIDPEAINITRKLYNHQQYRDDLLLKDIIEFDLALNDFDTRKLVEELHIFNYKVVQKENTITGTGPDIRVNIKRKTEHASGICRIKFSLTNRDYESQTIQFSDRSKLILKDNRTAEWYFTI